MAQDVFFGQVIEKLGQTRKYGYPETQFNVKVLEVLKGSLSGTVKVNQQGGTRIDGTQWRMEGDPTLLDPGKSYLFVTRHLPAEDWHTVSPGYGNIKLQAPPNGTKEEVLGSEHAGELRQRFNTAVENEIPYDPQGGSEETMEISTQPTQTTEERETPTPSP